MLVIRLTGVCRNTIPEVGTCSLKKRALLHMCAGGRIVFHAAQAQRHLLHIVFPKGLERLQCMDLSCRLRMRV